MEGAGVGPTLGFGATLGGESTLGGGSSLVGTTLGGWVCLGMDSTHVGWYNTGIVVVGTGGEISEVVSGFQSPNRSPSLEIDSRWLWYAVPKASLMSHERSWRDCKMRSLGVSVV